MKVSGPKCEIEVITLGVTSIDHFRVSHRKYFIIFVMFYKNNNLKMDLLMRVPLGFLDWCFSKICWFTITVVSRKYFGK